jgi:hypothetical protein
VLGYPAVNIPCNADIERASAAGQDVNPEFVTEAIAHGQKGITAVPVELPESTWLQKALSRSFDYAPFSNGVKNRVDALRSG